MHHPSLLLALGLLSALGRASPVLKGTNDTLARRLWSEPPTRPSTFLSRPISKLPVPTSIAPHHSQRPEPSWALAPEPTEVLHSLLVRQAYAPTEPISSDNQAATSMVPSQPEPSSIAPQHSQLSEPSSVLAPEPTEAFNSLLAGQAQSVSIVHSEPTSADIGPIQPATSIVPYEPTPLDIRPSVSFQPSSEPTETPIPVSPGLKSIIADPAPVISGPTPVNSGPTPIFSNPAPVISSSAPVISVPSPIITNPAPVIASSAPVISNPAPVSLA